MRPPPPTHSPTRAAQTSLGQCYSLASLARLLDLTPPVTVDALVLGGLSRIVRWSGSLAVPVRVNEAAAQPSCGGRHLLLDSKTGRAYGACSVCLVLGSGGVGVGGVGLKSSYLVESGRSSEGRLRLGCSAQPRCVVPRPPRLAALSVLPLEQFAPDLGGGGVLPASAALEHALKRASWRRLVWWSGRMSVTAATMLLRFGPWAPPSGSSSRRLGEGHLDGLGRQGRRLA